MKTNRHFLFVIHALVALAVLVLPAVVQAQFTFTTNNGAITITGYTGPGGAVVIPTTINNDLVTAIGPDAFNAKTNLTSITIPTNVVSIGLSGFAGCTALVNINLSTNLQSIAQGSFSGCSSLTNIFIPAGVKFIDVECFAACSSLTNIAVDPNNAFYSGLAGVLFDKNQTTLVGFPGGIGGSYTLPSSVTNIENFALELCTKLTYVALPGNLSYVGEHSFLFCTALTSVTVPASVTIIGQYAFADCYTLTNAVVNNGDLGPGCFEFCTNLATVTLANGVTSLGNIAFQQTSLMNVLIPASVTNIGQEVFTYSHNLTNITVVSSNGYYSSLGGVLFDKSQSNLIEYPDGLGGDYTVPGTVTNIEASAFTDATRITGVEFPNTLTTIGDYAFEGTALNKVIIPSSVNYIGMEVFGVCPNLTNACFEGNEPSTPSIQGVPFNLPSVFQNDPLTAILYVAGATGWGTNFEGIPTEVCAQCGGVGVGALQVTINPSGAMQDGAAWQVDGGAWQTSGAVVSNLPASNHNVSFTNIVGWFTPAAQTVTINSGVTTNISATYLPNIGALQVIINPICAVENGAAWQVDGGAWQTSGAVVTNLAGGNHTVSFTNIIGWLTPSSQTALVTANITNTATGDYIEGSTPGAITWINIGGPDQHWSTAANWDLNRAPTTNDIVLIPNTGGSTCIMDVDATVAGLIIGGCDSGGSDGLGINGHTLTVAGVLTIKSNAVFRVDSGILVGTSNTIISGVLGWTSGGLAGTLTLGSSGVLNISGGPGGQYFSNCLFTNNGTVNWSDDQLNVGGNVVIDNFGLWNAQDDQHFYGPNVVFNNYGTFRKSGGVGGYPGTYFNSGVVFNQLAGVLDIQSGTNGLWLTLTSGGSFTGGYVTTNLNGITYLGGGNFNINGTLTSANVLFGGSYLVGTNVINGGLNWQNGQWNNTVVTLSSNSVLTINNSAFQKGISGSIFTNYGTVNWSAAPVDADLDTVIDNYGVWNAQDDQYFNGGYWGAVFNNYGTFRKSGGVAGYPGTFFNSGAVFNQLAGVLDVQSGTNGLWLSLTSGGSFTGGYVTTNLNGITYLGGGNFNINGTLTSTNVLFGGSYLVGTNVINGGLNWQNGQWNNTVVTLSSNSVLTINNSAFQKGISGSIFTNYGTVNWSAAPVDADLDTVIDNYGVWNAQDDQYFNGGAGAVFNNYGTFRKSGGVAGYPGTFFNSGAVFNQLAGVLDVQSGTNGLWLSLTSGGSFTGGYVTTNLNGITYLGGGNFNINGTLTSTNVLFAGSYLVGTNVINGGLAWINGWWNGLVIVNTNSVVSIYAATAGKTFNGIVINYGTVNWSADQLNANGSPVIDNYGVWNAQDNQYFNGGAGVVFNNFGTFLKSGGAGGYPGTYFNSGTIFNQAGGTLSMQTGYVTLGGTYNLTNGTLNFGLNSLTDHGRLQLGTLTLGGTLSATVSGSYAPAVGDQFGVVGSSGLNGAFTSVHLPAGIVVSNFNNTVLLTVTGPVPVQLLNPQPVGTNFLFQFPTVSGQSYTVQRNDVLSSTNWVYYTNLTGSGTLFQFQTPVTITPAQRFFRVRQP